MKNNKFKWFFLLSLLQLSYSCSKEDSIPPPIPNPTPPKADTNLIAYYAFAGSAIDSTKYQHHGQVFNTELTTDRNGNANQAYYFKGGNSYIRIENSIALDLKESFSICAWVKTDVLSYPPGGQSIIVWRGDGQSGHDPYVLYINNTGPTIRKDVGNGGSINETSFALGNSYLNTWIHLAGTYDASNSTAKLYVNGNLVSEKTFSTSEINYSTSTFWNNIGTAQDGYTSFKGSIDEVKIYKKVLSASEVNTLSK